MRWMVGLALASILLAVGGVARGDVPGVHDPMPALQADRWMNTAGAPSLVGHATAIVYGRWDPDAWTAVHTTLLDEVNGGAIDAGRLQIVYMISTDQSADDFVRDQGLTLPAGFGPSVDAVVASMVPEGGAPLSTVVVSADGLVANVFAGTDPSTLEDLRRELEMAAAPTVKFPTSVQKGDSFDLSFDLLLPSTARMLLNQEFPLKVTLKPSRGITCSKATLGRDDATPFTTDAIGLQVSCKATSAGKKTIQLKFAYAFDSTDGQASYPRRLTRTITIAVAKPPPPIDLHEKMSGLAVDGWLNTATAPALDGRVAVLVFGHGGEGPDGKMMPAVIEEGLGTVYDRSRVQLVYMLLEDDQVTSDSILARTGIPWPIGYGASVIRAIANHADTYPQTVVVLPDGTVAAIEGGWGAEQVGFVRDTVAMALAATATAPASVGKGAPIDVEVSISRTELWTVNTEFPTKITVTPPRGVTCKPKTLGRDDAATLTTEEAVFHLACKASKPGKKVLRIALQYAYDSTDGTMSRPFKQTLTVPITVTAAR